jgi:5-methylcytosine-specific restriction endonuclease McrA
MASEKRKAEYFSGHHIGFAVKTIKKFIEDRDGHQCTICHRIEWQGQPIPLVMDHIDGNASNDAPDNLRLICGNCDMQLPTYKSKNRGKGRHSRKIRYAAGQSY